MNGKRGTVVSVDNELGRVQVKIKGMDKSSSRTSRWPPTRSGMKNSADSVT